MRSGRRIRVMLGATAVVLGGLALAAAWLVTSETALRWVASELTARSGGRLEVVGLEGSIAGPMRARRIRYATDAGELTATDVALAWTPRLLLARELHAIRISAAAVIVDVRGGTQPGQVRDSLALPIAVTLERVAVVHLEVRTGGNVWQAGRPEE